MREIPTDATRVWDFYKIFVRYGYDRFEDGLKEELDWYGGHCWEFSGSSVIEGYMLQELDGFARLLTFYGQSENSKYHCCYLIYRWWVGNMTPPVLRECGSFTHEQVTLYWIHYEVVGEVKSLLVIQKR